MEQANPEKRRARIPLSPEELFYFKELKKLHRAEQLQLFKRTRYYKSLNVANIAFVFIISYIVASAVFVCSWQKTYVLSLESSYGPVVKGMQRSISDVSIVTTGGHDLILKTSELYRVPRQFDAIWIGRDFLFGKILKARLSQEGAAYFHFHAYPLFFICAFMIFIVYVIYFFNLHLTRHGLLGITTLLSLACIYIVLV